MVNKVLVAVLNQNHLCDIFTGYWVTIHSQMMPIESGRRNTITNCFAFAASAARQQVASPLTRPAALVHVYPASDNPP